LRKPDKSNRNHRLASLVFDLTHFSLEFASARGLAARVSSDFRMGELPNCLFSISGGVFSTRGVAFPMQGVIFCRMPASRYSEDHSLPTRRENEEDMKQRRPMLTALASPPAPMSAALLPASDHPEWITVPTACKIVGGEKPISVRSYQRAVENGYLPRPRKMTGAGNARVHLPTLLSLLATPEPPR
jgi:hypothetical protein